MEASLHLQTAYGYGLEIVFTCRHRSRAPAVHLCHIPFMPNLRGRLDWYVIQQELLRTYSLSISTIAVSQFSGGIN